MTTTTTAQPLLKYGWLTM